MSEDTRAMFGQVVGELPGAHSRLRAAFIIMLLFMEWTRMGAVWRRDHKAGIEKLAMQRTLAEMGGMDVTEDKIREWREAWDVPPPPRPRDVFDLGHRGRTRQNSHNPTFLSQTQLIWTLATHGVPRPGARSSEACPTGVGGRDRPTAGTDFQIRRRPAPSLTHPRRRAKGTPSGTGPDRRRGSAGGTVLRQWTVVSPARDAHDSGRGPGR
jgi:hypothetical protein